MSFFDRRKVKERRADDKNAKEKISSYKGPEKRNGKDRRVSKERRQDMYHQMEASKRRAIDQIIELLEKKVSQ